jgi:hypothetical protein
VATDEGTEVLSPVGEVMRRTIIRVDLKGDGAMTNRICCPFITP